MGSDGETGTEAGHAVQRLRRGNGCGALFQGHCACGRLVAGHARGECIADGGRDQNGAAIAAGGGPGEGERGVLFVVEVQVGGSGAQIVGVGNRHRDPDRVSVRIGTHRSIRTGNATLVGVRNRGIDAGRSGEHSDRFRSAVRDSRKISHCNGYRLPADRLRCRGEGVVGRCKGDRISSGVGGRSSRGCSAGGGHIGDGDGHCGCWRGGDRLRSAVINTAGQTGVGRSAGRRLRNGEGGGGGAGPVGIIDRRGHGVLPGVDGQRRAAVIGEVDHGGQRKQADRCHSCSGGEACTRVDLAQVSRHHGTRTFGDHHRQRRRCGSSIVGVGA